MKIYGLYAITLLVCHVYACSKNHEIVGYHPGVLKQVPSCFIPFKLWHITGFTLEHVQLIASLLSFGMSIHKVREILFERIGWWYHHQKLKFMELNKNSSNNFPSQAEWFSSALPSQHSISSCFLADFWEKEEVYVKCMQSTTVNENSLWLSCDHTFASASKNVCTDVLHFWLCTFRRHTAKHSLLLFVVTVCSLAIHLRLIAYGPKVNEILAMHNPPLPRCPKMHCWAS